MTPSMTSASIPAVLKRTRTFGKLGAVVDVPCFPFIPLLEGHSCGLIEDFVQDAFRGSVPL